MKAIKRTALAAAVAMGSASGAHAAIDLHKNDDVRVYLHSQIEVEHMIWAEDPDDGPTEDRFDNEIEFGMGVEFDENWEAYFELEIDNLSDNSNSRVGDGRDGDIEARAAYIDYSDDNRAARVGVFRPNYGDESRLFYREHLVGARYMHKFGGGLNGEIGSGTLNEEGNAFDDDRQITWLKASLNGFYAHQSLFQDGPGDGETAGVDPADGPFGDLLNLAVGWSGSLGSIDTTLEFNQQFGEAENGEDYNGRAALAEFSTKVGSQSPWALFAWGSGDDDPNDNDVDEFQEARGDFHGTKIMLDEQFIENISTSGVGGVGENGEGIGNITMAQLGTKFKVNPVWKTSLSVSGLSLTEDNDEGDSYLGTELNMLNQWNLPTSRKVRLYLDLAYVFADDAFGPDDVWLIEPGVRVTF